MTAYARALAALAADRPRRLICPFCDERPVVSGGLACLRCGRALLGSFTRMLCAGSKRA